MAYAFAVTRPVNPAGATTILTEAQIWKGMEYKARNPKPFLPNFQSSKTISDTGNKSTVELPVEGSIVLTEDIELHAPTMVYFETDLYGLRVTNIISYGPAEELLLTWAFANGIMLRFPGIPADKPKPSAKELNERMGIAVEQSLEIVRKLVKEGKI
ncbi:DUF1857-domain-containing protein [Mycena galericulata]|nr:DUF1857-domain-containing protein [Mycena galericulata]